METKKYTVIVDNREKSGLWRFKSSEHCAGEIEGTLRTGDYTLNGLESVFSIERKASTGEFSGNITTKRFENELKRAAKMDHFYILLEFSLHDIINFPYGSSIPPSVWKKLRVTPNYLLKRIAEIETTYGVHIVFCGNKENAQSYATVLFKRMAQLYPDKIL